MKTLNFTIVADIYCPTSRTYLSYLRAHGYKPKKIILVHFTGVNKRDTFLRKILGHRLHAFYLHKRLRKSPSISNTITEFIKDIQRPFEVKIDYTSTFDFKSYADEFSITTATDYNDPDFQNYLIKQKCKLFLYTNGGIVPSTLLKRHDIKFLHIHPGIVPYVRGSDGLLWSIVTRGVPGVSCFYMDPGIDTGDLIGTKEFAPLKIDITPPNDLMEEDCLYRALLISYDPHMRASLLIDILRKYEDQDLSNLPTHAQIYEKIDNFLWMHPKLRLKVFREIICVKNKDV
jgi:hypothetical protein